jgi:hypothetical protein
MIRSFDLNPDELRYLRIVADDPAAAIFERTSDNCILKVRTDAHPCGLTLSTSDDEISLRRELAAKIEALKEVREIESLGVSSHDFIDLMKAVHASASWNEIDIVGIKSVKFVTAWIDASQSSPTGWLRPDTANVYDVLYDVSKRRDETVAGFAA